MIGRCSSEEKKKKKEVNEEEEGLGGGGEGAGSAGTLGVFGNCLFECGFVFTYTLEVCS